MLDKCFTSCIKFNSCFTNYKWQSQKVKVSTDKPFSSCATECIQGIPHLEIRTNYYCNSKTVYVTLRNYFKQCNNNILVFYMSNKICWTCKTQEYYYLIRKKNKGTILNFFLELLGQANLHNWHPSYPQKHQKFEVSALKEDQKHTGLEINSNPLTNV